MSEYLIVKNSKSGKTFKITRFKQYIVDQNIDIPADFFTFSISNINAEVSSKITAGDEVDFYVNDTLTMNGLIDDMEVNGSIESTDMEINGRDKTSILLDNDAIPTTLYKMTLKQYMEKKISPYGFSKFEVSNDSTLDKISISPGDSEWSVIEQIAKERGLYPRYDINTLKATTLRADTLADYHFSNDSTNTIKIKKFNIKLSSDIKSEVLVYGGHYSRGEYINQNNIKGSSKDSGVTFKKRRILNNDELENNKQANDMAKEELKSTNRNAFVIELELKTYQAIFINKVARVTIKKLNLDCYLLVTGVQYVKGIEQGSITKVTLKLIEGVSVKWDNHVIPTIPR